MSQVLESLKRIEGLLAAMLEAIREPPEMPDWEKLFEQASERNKANALEVARQVDERREQEERLRGMKAGNVS